MRRVVLKRRVENPLCLLAQSSCTCEIATVLRRRARPLVVHMATFFPVLLLSPAANFPTARARVLIARRCPDHRASPPAPTRCCVSAAERAPPAVARTTTVAARPRALSRPSCCQQSQGKPCVPDRRGAASRVLATCIGASCDPRTTLGLGLHTATRVARDPHPGGVPGVTPWLRARSPSS